MSRRRLCWEWMIAKFTEGGEKVDGNEEENDKEYEEEQEEKRSSRNWETT